MFPISHSLLSPMSSEVLSSKSSQMRSKTAEKGGIFQRTCVGNWIRCRGQTQYQEAGSSLKRSTLLGQVTIKSWARYSHYCAITAYSSYVSIILNLERKNLVRICNFCIPFFVPSQISNLKMVLGSFNKDQVKIQNNSTQHASIQAII